VAGALGGQAGCFGGVEVGSGEEGYAGYACLGECEGDVFAYAL